MATFASRPDTRYYINIQEFDDGSFAADQMPLDDQTITMPMMPNPIVNTGLRTYTKNLVNVSAQTYIETYAPDWAQRNALHAITQAVPGPELDAANEMWDWINDVRAQANTKTTEIETMTFNQLVVYVTSPNWPAPPASLLPA